MSLICVDCLESRERSGGLLPLEPVIVASIGDCACCLVRFKPEYLRHLLPGFDPEPNGEDILWSRPNGAPGVVLNPTDRECGIS